MTNTVHEAPRAATLAQLIRDVREALAHGVDRAALAAVEALLGAVAARRELWDEADFPNPPPGAQQRRYLVHEEPDHTLALYLMVMRRGKRTPVHDHQTWACIAAVEGAETNHLYRCLARDPARGLAELKPAGTKVVRPGEALSFLPEDVHAVSIEQDDMIRHLHLYGRALETLHDRVVFQPEAGRCEPMYIHVPTLRRGAGGAWSVALGDRIVDGRRWSYVDTQGPGEVLLMLPGALGNCRAFDPMLDRLSSRYRVVVLSYPAIGDVRAIAAGALGFLRAAKLGRVTVFGTSLGGYVAQWMAALDPSVAARLVLANAFADPRPAQDAAELERLQAGDDAGFKAAALSRLEALPAGDFRDRMLAMVRTQPGDSLRLRRIAVLSGPPVPALPAGCVAVTIVDAADDPVLPPAMREGLLAQHPGAEHRRFATGGHHLHFSHAGELAGLLLSLPKESS